MYTASQDAAVAVAAEELAQMNKKLDALTRQVDYLVERQRWQADLLDELGPILRLAMNAGARNLAELEKKGYFAFGAELLAVADRIVTHYGAEDVRRLGDQVVRILDVVRSLTQPDVMSLAKEATDVLHRADRVAPLGVVGMVRASQDDDVQRGMAILMQMLRQVGKAATLVSAKERPARRQMGVAQPPVATQARAPAAAPACKVVAPAKAVSEIDGIAYTADGFLANPAQWTPELAATLAAAHGVPQLSPAHWKLIEFARAEYAATSVSPNIRRLTTGTGLTTKEIYGMFPKAPGKLTALLAGIPKPAGCI